MLNILYCLQYNPLANAGIWGSNEGLLGKTALINFLWEK
jgi:hypothetical protein